MRGPVLLLIHLRLPFQLMLAPIFLLGVWITGAGFVRWIVPFVLVHVGLYGGATAYNSYHDQDQGPIGFLKRPIAATRFVRDGGIAFQVIAVAGLAVLRPVAGLVAATMALMGIAYSHPRMRWKASTAGGLIAVALGQGAGAVLLGYLSAGGPLPAVTTLAGAAAGAGILTAGIYPLTQIYQIEEDRNRGDITLPVRIGWHGTFVFSAIVATTGLVTLGLALRAVLTRPALLVLLAAPAGLWAGLLAWRRRFPRQSDGRNHDWAMGIGVAAAVLFLLLLLAGWSRGASAFAPPSCATVDSATVDVLTEGKLTHVHATAFMPGEPALVWSVILDYENLPRYVSVVDSSRVVSRGSAVDVVRQVGVSRLIVTFTMCLVLEFRRVSPDLVSFRMLEGDLSSFFGTWQVVPAPGGSFVTYDARLRHGLPIPGPLNRRFIGKLGREIIRGVKGEVERRRGSDSDARRPGDHGNR